MGLLLTLKRQHNYKVCTSTETHYCFIKDETIQGKTYISQYCWLLFSCNLIELFYCLNIFLCFWSLRMSLGCLSLSRYLLHSISLTTLKIIPNFYYSHISFVWVYVCTMCMMYTCTWMYVCDYGEHGTKVKIEDNSDCKALPSTSFRKGSFCYLPAAYIKLVGPQASWDSSVSTSHVSIWVLKLRIHKSVF